jgi:hypothetical protein
MRFIIVLTMMIAISSSLVLCASEPPKERVIVSCFPNICKIGDTVYVVVEVSNPHDVETYFYNMFLEPILNTVQIELADNKGNVLPFLFESCSDTIETPNWSPPRVRLEPHERRVVRTYSVTVPPFEDLYGQEYWQNWLLQKRFLPSFKLRFTVALANEAPLHQEKWEMLKTKVCYEKSFVISQRTATEMSTLKSWYDATPTNLLPVMDRVTASIPFKRGHKSYLAITSKLQPQHYHFLRIGNRYPGYPNLPKDWRGWKELEESFCEGTLRDEIRWTRICIQYCETKDEKVLEELKSWLEKMNPIQRAVMVNYIQKNEQLPESIKLHNTIQPFKNKPITNDIDKK